MIADIRVLQPEFIPNEVKHRDAEVEVLSTALHPLFEGNVPESTFIFGPSGVGKTCIAQFIIDELGESIPDLNYQYVNCWEDRTRFKTSYRILDGISETFDIHRRSTPKDVLLERIREYSGVPYVVILDEVDQLVDKSLLYELYRIQGLTMMLISNREEEFFASLNSRLKSRFHACTRVRFDKYSDDELIAILRDRARWGLADGVINTNCLEIIVDNVAGDARAAIDTLRKAAQVAHRSGDGTISCEVVQRVVPEARAEIKQRSLDKLTEHERALYEIIRDQGETTPSVLVSRYRERVKNPKTQRMVRNHLAKLEQYNLIVAIGQTKGRTYRLWSFSDEERTL